MFILACPVGVKTPVTTAVFMMSQYCVKTQGAAVSIYSLVQHHDVKRLAYSRHTVLCFIRWRRACSSSGRTNSLSASSVQGKVFLLFCPPYVQPAANCLEQTCNPVITLHMMFSLHSTVGGMYLYNIQVYEWMKQNFIMFGNGKYT